MNSEIRVCQNCKKDFTIEPDDFSFYEKIKVPPPTFCPECRMQRRLAWNNDLSLYNRNCGLCNKPIITIYSNSSGINAYCNKCWWSDKWNSSSYGEDYDFSEPFFKQFNALVKKVPHMALINDNGIGSINSEYTNNFFFAKNCYMVFCAWKVEDVMYSYYLVAGKNLIDCLNVMSNCEWAYECIQPENCYQIKYSQFTNGCQDSQFLYDCHNCSNCFMCSGLRNKKYYFKNEQYEKDEYEKILNDYKLDTFSGVEKSQKEFDKFILRTPRRFAQITHSFNCTGDLLKNGKNTKNSFNVQSSENCNWVINSDNPIDCYDQLSSGETSECYEGITSDHSNRNIFGVFSVKSQNIEYTHHCYNSKHLFGCVGLKNKEYCILNKQYTSKEYFEMIDKIKKHMNALPYTDKKDNIYRYGEFFPAELSYFGYNETSAQDNFPLLKEDILSRGLVWQNNIQMTIGKETVKPEDIPDSINDIPESVTEEIFRCIDCNRNYRIIFTELEFYKRMNIPLPRKCFHCRHNKRLMMRNPYKLWHRSCMNKGCNNEFETSYAPDRPEIVYCEKCYQREVY